jgi:hypothetical protein
LKNVNKKNMDLNKNEISIPVELTDIIKNEKQAKNA